MDGPEHRSDLRNGEAMRSKLAQSQYFKVWCLIMFLAHLGLIARELCRGDAILAGILIIPLYCLGANYLHLRGWQISERRRIAEGKVKQ